MWMRLTGCLVLSTLLLVLRVGVAQERSNGTVVIPRTWDDAAVATHEVPLADSAASPRHVSSDYYYRIPVRPIPKGYPVYAPGREPAGYLDWLKRQDPVIAWDDKGNAPSLESETDWIRAGEVVFDAPGGGAATVALEDVRSAKWLEATRAPVAADGTLPWFQYIVRSQGEVTLSGSGCAFCHTRVMTDGSIIKGAQGNLPVQRAVAFRWRSASAAASDKEQYLAQLRTFLKRLHAAPHLRPDPEDRIDSMSVDEIANAVRVVSAEHGTSPSRQLVHCDSSPRPDRRERAELSRSHRPRDSPIDRRHDALCSNEHGR